MEPTEDGSRNTVPGWNTSHGCQPTRADRWLHAKTAMGSAMIVTNVVLETRQPIVISNRVSERRRTPPGRIRPHQVGPDRVGAGRMTGFLGPDGGFLEHEGQSTPSRPGRRPVSSASLRPRHQIAREVVVRARVWAPRWGASWRTESF